MIDHKSGDLLVSLISDIQQTSQTGTPLGSDKFIKEVEELLGVKTGYTKRGRSIKIELIIFKGY